ncbi:MAG: RDD family protein [Pseudomonadota bacterium]
MEQERHLLRRTVAYTIDAGLAVAILMLNFIVILIGVMISPSINEVSPAAAVMIGVCLLVTSIIAYGYFLLRDGLPGGSLGKRLMGITVIDVKTGAPCSKKQSFLRNLLLMVLGALDLVVPFFRKNGRRIGDDVAGTVVVSRGKQA